MVDISSLSNLDSLKVELIKDGRFKHRYGNSVLNTFGGTGTMIHYQSRTDEGWGVEVLNGGVYHGLTWFDFSAIPANPVPGGDGYAGGMWCISGGVNPKMRIHYGVSLNALRSHDTWTFSMWYCALPSTHPMAQVNLTSPTTIDPAYINMGEVKFALRILDATQSIDLLPHTVMYSGGSADGLWHKIDYTFTIPDGNKAFMNNFGSNRGKLELIAYGDGHVRYLVYDLHCVPVL